MSSNASQLQRLPLIALLTSLVAACSGTGTLVAPPATPAPVHLYVGTQTSPGVVAAYTLPITTFSVPAFSFPSDLTVEVAIDQNGDLITEDNSAVVKFYPAPLSAASTASATFQNGVADPIRPNGQIALTAAGDFFATNVSAKINFFAHPFTNATTPTFTVTVPGLGAGAGAIGAGLDASGNLYVSTSGGAATKLYEFAPPYTGAPVVITPGVNGASYRKIAINGSALYVSEVVNSRIDVYNLPLTNASVPAFSIPGATGFFPEALAFDSAGNLYVGNYNANPNVGSNVAVYAPPFSAASTPSVMLRVQAPPNAPFFLYGLAIGK